MSAHSIALPLKRIVRFANIPPLRLLWSSRLIDVHDSDGVIVPLPLLDQMLSRALCRVLHDPICRINLGLALGDDFSGGRKCFEHVR